MDSKGGGINVNITYGEQRNESESHIRGTESGGSTVAAGGVVRLNAAGAGKDSDLTVTGSDVAGKGGTVLLAENNINLLAAEENHSERSSNSQRGWNAGVALDFSNGVSVGFTGGGNYGKGYGNGDEQTYRTTRIGDANSQTVIQSGGDTTLKGAQVKGSGVALSAENLRIESLQDSAAYNSRQFQGSGQITVGYGFSGSADYSQSKINAEHRSVNDQSGIYAGDDGFQVDVSNHTDLKGGIITSTEAAEQNGRNRFQTATLTQSDLQNHSRYEGESFGLGVSGGMSGEALGQEQNSRLKTVQPENGSSMGYGRDGGSQSSVTRSGIGTRNIVITNDTTGEQAKAVYTDTRTETAEADSGRLNNAFDKDEVQREIDLQRSVSQDFSRNVQQARTEINRKVDNHKELAKAEENKAAEALQKGDLAAYREAVQTANEHHQKADDWQKGGVALAAFATGLSAPTDSALGITAATASPVAAYQIGQYFKGVAAQNSDGRLTAAQETARVVAHGVIAAATAAAGDHNALSAAISAGGAEAAAPYVSQWLYGEKDGSKLTAEQKQTVSSILSLGGAAVGAAANGSAADMVAGGQAAQTAVENNYYLTANSLTKTPREVRNIYEVLKDKVNQECSNGRIQECRQDIERIIAFVQDSRFARNYRDLQLESMQFLSDNPKLLADYLTAQYDKLSREDKSILHRYITPGTEIVGGASGIVISVKGGAATCVQSFGLTCGAAAIGVASSSDHLITGLNNFGKKASEQRPTITVQSLKRLGLSEQAANYVQLAMDTLSVGKVGISTPRPKPATPVTVRITSGGTANAATYPKLINELNEQNLKNIAAQDSRLASALNDWKSMQPNRRGEINFGIGSATHQEADKLGKIWVGDGAKPVNSPSCKGCLLSADGTRLYRPPSTKVNTPKSFNPTGVQANFVIRSTDGKTLTNGHLNIK
ncbi:hemagglutinin repeat-containing protein [Neisseria sp. 19428wB4_WF04]|nr:hemagglutinin repeat-containing protein [Neisseria sp. 19428wB4_WF04]MBF0803307.1 hemagglutinin repeat-containing protein [Neisseria sp. 19428wB4_WF04]